MVSWKREAIVSMNVQMQPTSLGFSIPLAGHIVTVRMYLQLHLGQMTCVSKGKCSPTIFSEMHSSFCFLFSAGNKGLNWRRHMMREGENTESSLTDESAQKNIVVGFQEAIVIVWTLHSEVLNREHSPKQTEVKLKTIFYVKASHGHVRLQGQQWAIFSFIVHCADCIKVGKLTSKCMWNVSEIGYKQAKESFLKPVRKVNFDDVLA